MTVGGPSGHSPLNSTPPSISPSGTVAIGTPLTCSAGAWSGGVTPPYAYVWRRDGGTIGGANSATYTPVASDAGSRLTCTVVASNGYGSGAATSAEVTVADASPPSNTGPGTTAPSLSGSGHVGTALTCDKGTWTGTGITYRYAWSRNGTPIADSGSERYVVLTDDLAHSITCTVTARNTAGTGTATTTSMSLDALVVGAPTSTTAPEITGTAAVGQTLTCSTGTWTGAPTGYATIWQRNGETVGPSSTHVVVAADLGATLRCVVIATNAAGRGAARSAPVGGGACTGAAGVVINGGDAQTSSPQVQLSIRVPGGTTSIAISNSSDMSGARTVTPSGTCTYAWTMDSIPGLPLPWSVHVQLNGAGTIYTDSIVVDEPAMLARPW